LELTWHRRSSFKANAWFSFSQSRLDSYQGIDQEAFLEEELSGLDTAVIYIRRRMNALRPVQRLPRELFENVFILLRDDCIASERSRIKGAPAWIKACSHVCYRWREVRGSTSQRHGCSK
jgi:hypothetical protein